MIVTVRFLATFRDFLPRHANRSGLQLDVHERATVQALMKALRVPDELAKIVLVNGQHASEDSFLTDGDIVTVFPPLIGGCSSNEG